MNKRILAYLILSVAGLIYLVTLSHLYLSAVKVRDKMARKVVNWEIPVDSTLRILPVDTLLQPLVMEFIIEARRRNIDILPDILEKVGSINLVHSIEYPLVGVTLRGVDYNDIFIADYSFIDRIIVRRVLYHELGHALTVQQGPGCEHVCDDCDSIMSAHAPSSFYSNADPIIWEKLVDELFEWIQENK